MKKEKLYFENLDSIRFIAAAMVFIGHSMSNSYKYLNIDGTFLEKILNIISNGGIGVSVFFVLSGFLITFLLISEFHATGKIQVRDFYMRRVLRIWPLYFAVITFSFLIYPAFKSMFYVNNPRASDILYHLTFLSNFDVLRIEKFYHGEDAMSQNITWSVSIEEQFYLIWPLLFAFFSTRFWICLISAIILGSLIFRIFNYQDEYILYFHSFSVMVDLGIGGFFACLIKNSEKIKLFFEKTSTRSHLLFFCIPICLLLWNDILFDFEYGIAVSRIFLATSFAFIISAQALTKSNSALNLKRLSFADKWGKYTYGIYLLHPIAILLVSIGRKSMHISDDSFISIFVAAIISFVLTLVISKLSYKYFESKFLRYKNKFEVVSKRDLIKL